MCEKAGQGGQVACINCDAAASACFAHSTGVQVVIMADGQVTRGNEIVKPNVTKVRRLNDSVISGFAGGVLETPCSHANSFFS